MFRSYLFFDIISCQFHSLLPAFLFHLFFLKSGFCINNYALLFDTTPMSKMHFCHCDPPLLIKCLHFRDNLYQETNLWIKLIYLHSSLFVRFFNASRKILWIISPSCYTYLLPCDLLCRRRQKKMKSCVSQTTPDVKKILHLLWMNNILIFFIKG